MISYGLYKPGESGVGKRYSELIWHFPGEPLPLTREEEKQINKAVKKKVKQIKSGNIK